MPPGDTTIREYEPDRDHRGLHECVVQLQEFERALEPLLPPGEEIAEPYLGFLLSRCAEADGRIFVAEIGGKVAGFVSVLARVQSQEVDDPAEYAYISDVLVLPNHRGKGVGRRLLEHAEGFARKSGARILRVSVLARNRDGYDLYRRLGFSDYQLQLAKPL
jgi:ribosomal protein S18 acetylase RimI-like enzyme